MRFSWDFPYRSQRMPVLAGNVVATSQPLAASAGLRMLHDGGNAVDAALAAAIALTVVEPTSNGLGSDAFALVHARGKLHGLNASGRAPSAWAPALFAGLKEMPQRGWNSATVPGAVSAWMELSGKFGRLPFRKLFEPAIAYAEEGFLVSPFTAQAWRQVPEIFSAFPEIMRVFTLGGRAPHAGERFACPELACTLRAIAASGGEDFYRGEIAARIARASATEGGHMTREDLAAHQADWIEPLALAFRGSRVHELPPNGQGMAAQIALGILGHLDFAEHAPDSAESLHLQIEAMKLAFADIQQHVADPAAMTIDPRRLLDDGYLKRRAVLIDRKRATLPATGIPRPGGTVYLAAADAAGMMVSLIQSNYQGFGSGVVVPGTGIALQNRGFGFTLESGHPNQVGPRKRPFHTIIPSFITAADGEPWAAFGVMGGSMQAQGHVQVVGRVLGHGQNPQAAIDAPRWCVQAGFDVMLEGGHTEECRAGLQKLGHHLVAPVTAHLGGAQMIARLGSGYLGASDSRKDGLAVGL